MIWYAYWPQIRPAFWSIVLLRWDINVRESAVLGLVGAGGIGMALDTALNLFQWDRVPWCWPPSSPWSWWPKSSSPRSANAFSDASADPYSVPLLRPDNGRFFLRRRIRTARSPRP